MSKDTHYRIMDQPSDVEPELVINSEYSEILKSSNPKELLVANKTLFGGSEDCIDIVRMGEVLIQDCKLYPGIRKDSTQLTKQGITLKGGCDKLTLRHILFFEGFRRAEIVLGDHTIYWPNTPKMRNVVIGPGIERSDGKKVRVVALWCDKVTVADPSKVTVFRYPQPLVWVAFHAINLINKVKNLFKRA